MPTCLGGLAGLAVAALTVACTRSPFALQSAGQYPDSPIVFQLVNRTGHTVLSPFATPCTDGETGVRLERLDGDTWTALGTLRWYDHETNIREFCDYVLRPLAPHRLIFLSTFFRPGPTLPPGRYRISIAGAAVELEMHFGDSADGSHPRP